MSTTGRKRCTHEGCRRLATTDEHCPDHAPNKGGRPTKLTRTLLDQLDEIADDQWSIRDACTAIGIGETTWRRWEADPTDEPHLAEFRSLAARVRAGAGSKVDDLAWGVLREVLEDPDAERSERVTAATNALRLRTAHKVELTGRDGGPVRTQRSVDLSRLSAEELRTLRELTAKAEGDEA